MPDYAPNFTQRLKMTYSVQSHSHHAITRLARGSSLGAALDMADAIEAGLTNLGTTSLYADFTIIDWQYCQEDVSVFIPMRDGAGVIGTQSTSTRAQSMAALELTLPYRTEGGGHGFYALYGSTFSPLSSEGQDFRIGPGESTPLAAMRGALAAAGIYGNDDTLALYKTYWNVGFNARWKRRVRNG